MDAGARTFAGDFDTGQGDGDDDPIDPVYSNFDNILDQITRISQLRTTCHAPGALLYFVPMLIGC